MYVQEKWSGGCADIFGAKDVNLKNASGIIDNDAYFEENVSNL